MAARRGEPHASDLRRDIQRSLRVPWRLPISPPGIADTVRNKPQRARWRRYPLPPALGLGSATEVRLRLASYERCWRLGRVHSMILSIESCLVVVPELNAKGAAKLSPKQRGMRHAVGLPLFLFFYRTAFMRGQSERVFDGQRIMTGRSNFAAPMLEDLSEDSRNT